MSQSHGPTEEEMVLLPLLPVSRPNSGPGFMPAVVSREKLHFDDLSVLNAFKQDVY